MDDTASVIDALKSGVFRGLTAPRRDNICYATQNRQERSRQLARPVIWCFVVGKARTAPIQSPAASLIRAQWVHRLPIDGRGEIQSQCWKAVKQYRITAGFCADILVRQVIRHLQWLAPKVRKSWRQEEIHRFSSMPRNCGWSRWTKLVRRFDC